MSSNRPRVRRNLTQTLRLLAPVCALAVASCATIQPAPLTDDELSPTTQADLAAAQSGIEPLTGPLSLEEALARAFKYNLDRRAKMLEEQLALGQFNVAQFDMLPKLMANVDFSSRNNDHISQSRNAEDGTPSPSRFISQDRTHTQSDLGLTWSLLDLGVAYYASKQAADRLLIASERRSRAMHTLGADVRTAYWRAASAQRLRDQVNEAKRAATEALADARKAENERVRNPLDALRYQRQVLENLRLLESVELELSRATVELAALINAPRNTPLVLADLEPSPDTAPLALPLAVLEETALANNTELREAHYNSRIARIETRRTLVRLFPNLSFSYSTKYDTDTYLVNNHWNQAGMQLSANLFNLATGPAQIKLAEAGVALADQRRVALQMAVLTQVHLARLQLAQAHAQFLRAEEIWQVEQRIASHLANREAASSTSKLERVSADTAKILSHLRRYQSLAEMQAAQGRLAATIGLTPAIASVDEMSLTELARQLALHKGAWASLAHPTQPADKR